MGLNKIWEFLDNKIEMKWRAKIFLWYYRILQTSFGGVTIDDSGLSVNNYWKAYGIIFGLASGIWNLFSVYLFQSAPIMIELYGSGFVTNYYMSLTMKALVEIRCIFLFWFLQTHGILFFRTFFAYRIEKCKNLIQLFFVWILHILVPIAVGVYQLYRLRINQKPGESLGFYRIFFLLLQTFLNFSVSWSITFLMWNISLCALENLKKIEADLKKLSQHTSGTYSIPNPIITDLTLIADLFQPGKTTSLMSLHRLSQNISKGELIATSRALFFDIKRHMQVLDRSIWLAVVVDVSVAIVFIMVQIHALAQNSPVLRQYATIIGFSALSEIIRLIINCWVNGLVDEQTDQIMALLDDINTNDLDEYAYRQLLAFKTMSRDIGFGFTVGGLAPLRKTTLLSIFCFMMNYAVILVQTAKHM